MLRHSVITEDHSIRIIYTEGSSRYLKKGQSTLKFKMPLQALYLQFRSAQKKWIENGGLRVLLPLPCTVLIAPLVYLQGPYSYMLGSSVKYPYTHFVHTPPINACGTLSRGIQGKSWTITL